MRLAVCFAATVLALVTAENLGFAQGRAEHTVDWYRTHQAEREDMLRSCQNDHSLDGTGDCMNALSGSHAALADSFLNDARMDPEGKNDPEADPAYYGHNGPLIAMTLAQCARHPEGIKAWCTGAQTAKDRMR